MTSKPFEILKNLAKKKLITAREFAGKAISLIAKNREINQPVLTQKLIDGGRTGTQSEVNARMKAIGV